MEDNKKDMKSFDERVAEKAAKKFEVNYNTTVDTTSLLARTEALNIITSILNAFLHERQKGENKLSDVEIAAIQNAVIVESNKTRDIYTRLEETFKKEKNV